MIQAARKLVINFHGLGHPHDRVGPDEVPYWCDFELFEQLVDRIDELRHDRQANIGITFDDGHISDLTIAAPVLRARKMSATFFVCAGRIADDPAYMSSTQLNALETMGMRIGCHGYNHIRLPGLSPAALARETTDAREVLEAVLGHPVTQFAIPFGAYNRRVIAALAGFRHVHTSDHWMSAADSRIVTRHSYIHGWDDRMPERILSQSPGPLRRMTMAARLLAKRNRP